MTDGYKIKRILVWQGGQEKQVYPAGWKPGANTLAYRPFTSVSTVNDQTNNGHNGTNHGVAFGSYAGVDCGYFNRSSYISVPDAPELRGGDAYTISLWYNYNGGGVVAIDFYSKGKDDDTSCIYNRIVFQNSPLLQTNIGASNYIGGNSSSSILSGWHNWLVVRSAPNTLLYIDGQLAFSGTQTSSYTNTNNVLIGAGIDWSSTRTYYFSGYMSNVIIENKAWSAQEVQDYYNQTKSTYGL